MRLAAASRIQGFTLKRALFRNMLRLAIALRLDWLITNPLPKSIALSPEFDIRTWLHHVSCDLDNEQLTATVIWPWPPGSDRGRVYVHLLNSSGKAVAFAKVSLNEANDEHLRTEAQMLSTFRANPLKSAKVPSPLSTGLFQGRYYIIIEPVPETARPVKVSMETYPTRVIEEISDANTTMSVENLSELPWWNRFLEQEDIPDFINDLTTQLTISLPSLCRVHGDFEPKNLVEDEKTIWVLDWEQSTVVGPWLADPLRYYLLVNSRKCKHSPLETLSEILHYRRADKSSRARLDVGLALAFLHAAGSAEATLLLRHWQPSSKE